MGGEELLRDTVFEGEVEDDRNDLVEALEIVEETSLVIHLFDERGEDEISLWANIVFDGKLQLAAGEIRGFEEMDIPVDEATTDLGTFLRASFQTDNHSVSIRGELQDGNDMLEVQVTVDGLLLGTVVLDRVTGPSTTPFQDSTRSRDASL